VCVRDGGVLSKVMVVNSYVLGGGDSQKRYPRSTVGALQYEDSEEEAP